MSLATHTSANAFQVEALNDVPTPAMVVDAAVVKANLAKMQAYVDGHGLKLRPHTKTHKSRMLAGWQIAEGAAGLTAAKVGEAKFMADVCEDLLLAYPAIDRHRLLAVTALARRHTLRIAVDTLEGVARLADAARAASATIGILVDLDVGLARTGVQDPQAALQLAQAVDQAESLRLDGLFCYPGHIWRPAEEQVSELRAVTDLLQETLDLWAANGLSATIVSGGSTPTAYQSHLITPYTEIRPGTYIFNDVNTVKGGFCTIDDCAARIVCTVVSDAVPGRVVIDAGSKTLTSDRCIPALDSGHGHVVEFPNAKITRLSEEHGELDITSCDPVPALGQRLTVIPNHICPCVNLQDSMYLLHEDESLQTIDVDARGLLH